MNTLFPFSTTGIHAWQREVSLGGQTAIDTECIAISSDFDAWIVSRFDLSTEQTNFIASLDPLVIQSYSAAIQYALQQDILITLEKEEKQNAAREVMNEKIIIMEEKLDRWLSYDKTSATGEKDTGSSLIFKIYYQ